MFHFHQVNGFRHSLWFIPIQFFGFASCYSAETTASCAGVAQYHECRSAFAPALTHIGTIAAFANGMKLMIINDLPDLFKILADGKFYPKPVWFFGSEFRYDGKFCHLFLNSSTANRTLNGASQRKLHRITAAGQIIIIQKYRSYLRRPNNMEM